MAARPITLQDGIQIHVVHRSIIHGIGGRQMRIEHLPATIELVKPNRAGHNAQPDKSPQNLTPSERTSAK